MSSLYPFWTLFAKETRRFFRVYGQTVFTPMVSSMLYLLIFGISIGDQIQVQEGVSYMEFIVPGLIMMGTINNAFLNPSSSLMISKIYGDIEDLRVSPLTEQIVIWGMTCSSTLRGIVVAAVVFLVSQVFLVIHLGSTILPQHFFLLVLLLALAGATFGLLGFCIGIWAKSFELINSMSQFVILPLIYLGGVFFSIDQLHVVWKKAAFFNPVFYYVSGIRYAYLGKADVDFSTSLYVIVFTFFVAYVLALLSARKGSYRKL